MPRYYLKLEIRDPLDHLQESNAGDVIDKIAIQYAKALDEEDGYPDWSFHADEPTKADAQVFVTEFKLACEMEYGSKKDKILWIRQLKALEQIQNYLANQGGSADFSPGFSRVNRWRYAIELAIRVRKPSVVAQAGANLCGAASVIMGLFRSDPENTTQMALDLIETGRMKYGKLDIEPHHLVISSAQIGIAAKSFDMAPVDWVLMGSLRYHVEPLAMIASPCKDLADDLRHLTKPGLLVSWLRKMGMTDAADRTIKGESVANPLVKVVDKLTRYPLQESLHAGSPAFNLKKASNDLELGKLVFLWGTVDLSDETQILKYRQDKQRYPAANRPNDGLVSLGFPDLHWTLARKLIISERKVQVRHYTWGRVRQAEFDKDDFLNGYYGHVVASPMLV